MSESESESDDGLEGRVHGYARVAYRYRGKYLLNVEPFEDIGDLKYKHVLWSLLKSVPNDSLAFARWKASKITQLLEVEEFCLKNAATNGHGPFHATENTPSTTTTYPSPTQLLPLLKSAYQPEVLDKPYQLWLPVLWRYDPNDLPQLRPCIFEVDLDNMCFLLQGYPILKLQPNMPRPSLIYKLHATYRTNSYAHRCSFGNALPEKYRYDIFQDVSPCLIDHSDAGLLSYSLHAPTILESHEVLCVSRSTATAESASLTFRETLVGIYLKYHGPKILRHIVLAGDHRTLSQPEKSLALALVATALSPSYAYSTDHLPRWTDMDDTSWWPRKHICVTFAGHLHFERNCHAAVGRLVDEILRNDSAPTITFGVAFSVLHCILVRVCKDDTSAVSVARTHPLQFLPDFCGNNPSTPGTEALGRLGYQPASDDIQFFHSMLRSIPLAVPKPRPPNPSVSSDQQNPGTALESTGACNATIVSRSDIGSGSAAPVVTTHTRNPNTLLHLPPELILSIAEYLCHPRDLNALAVTCTTLMATCLPLLRLPQVFDICGPDQHRLHPLPNSTARLGGRDSQVDDHVSPTPTGFILYEHRYTVMEDEADCKPDLFSNEYWTLHAGREVALVLAPSGVVHLNRNDMRAPSGPEFPVMQSRESQGRMILGYDDVGVNAVGRTDFEGEKKPERIVLQFDVFYWGRGL